MAVSVQLVVMRPRFKRLTPVWFVPANVSEAVPGVTALNVMPAINLSGAAVPLEPETETVPAVLSYSTVVVKSVSLVCLAVIKRRAGS